MVSTIVYQTPYHGFASRWAHVFYFCFFSLRICFYFIFCHYYYSANSTFSYFFTPCDAQASSALQRFDVMTVIATLPFSFCPSSRPGSTLTKRICSFKRRPHFLKGYIKSFKQATRKKGFPTVKLVIYPYTLRQGFLELASYIQFIKTTIFQT